MKIEYEEFDDIEGVFMQMAAGAPPMKNTMPVNSYKGYVLSFIPLSTSNDAYLMIYAKGSLDPGIYEFDMASNSYKKVDAIERADKVYFVSQTPLKNTIADEAIKAL